MEHQRTEGDGKQTGYRIGMRRLDHQGRGTEDHSTQHAHRRIGSPAFADHHLFHRALTR